MENEVKRDLLIESQNELSIIDIYSILNVHKKIIIGFIGIFSISSLIVSLLLPNIYSSSSLLAPSNQNDTLASKLSTYSSIAGFAGIELPEASATRSQEAIETIKSFKFFVQEFLPNIKLEDLMAVKKWIPSENKIIYKKKDFDVKSNSWIRDVRYPKKVIPSDQEAYEIYSDIISINEYTKTSFVRISIEHKSPYIARDWANIIVTRINKTMKDYDINQANSSILFLNNYLDNTSIQSTKDAASNLLEAQMQTLMLANSTSDYIYKTIEAPIAPELKSKPRRLIICIFGFLIGLVFGVTVAFVLDLKNKKARA